MYKVRVSEQVESFLRRLPPESKHRLREAIGKLARESGDIKALENDLSGFYRLRVGRLRVVFCYVEPSTIDCVFAAERKLVYEVFSTLLHENIRD